MKYELAIFDMDGTILNTLDDLADSINYALKVNGFPTRTIDEVRSFVGNGTWKLVERAMGGSKSQEDSSLREDMEKVFDTFKEYYKDHCAIKTCPYEGINDVISTLRNKGIKTAVVSNKPEFAVKSLCDEYFAGLFDYAVGDKEGQRRKPYPDGVNAVIEQSGVDKTKAIYIGDSDVDFATAQNAKIDVIMVGWGFRDEDFLRSCGAKQVIHNPEEILNFWTVYC